MKRYLLLIPLFGILLTLVPAAAAQDSDGVEITWPPPVTEIWGSSDIMGTAAVPGMAYYYLDYLALNPDLSQPDDAPWIPLTVAVEIPITNGTLATIDTTRIPDGIYALRVVVNMLDGDKISDIVTPIRVNNQRYQLTLTPDAGSVYALPAAPLTAVNVRRCDLVDNFRCAYVASLTSEGGQILAISSNGSGWYQIRVPSGITGWVSPTVIAISGDVSSLPQVMPPAPLPAPTAAPPVTPLGVIPNGIAIEGNRATCGQSFNLHINLYNSSNTTSQPGTVSIQDVRVRTGQVVLTAFGTFPALPPGGNFVAVVPMIVPFYASERHELRAQAGGQTLSMRYVLARGGCEPQAGPTPLPGAVVRNFPRNACSVVFPDNTPAYNAPFGSIITYLAAATKEARQGQYVNDSGWYRIEYPELGQVWVRRGGSVRIQGRCSIRT